ncbi:hypothetical protein DKX38_018467 [Salix brachista]|uniref:Uncharacterized protein n=1 Tax=Salix brachista TaxID=2182728 RepID=A0A5N5KN86_9ROSI|nr:hypothetical protein DKX38_018467 [Salix brachista]
MTLGPKSSKCMLLVVRIWIILFVTHFNRKQKTPFTPSGRSLPIYYGELVEIFQELDWCDKVNMRDPDDIIMYKAFVEKFRIHIFLNDLDVEFEQVRGEILSMYLSLHLERTHAYVHHEANHPNLLTGEVTASNFMAMLARRNTPPI